MKASLRGTEIFFDVDGASLVVDGSVVRERPTAFAIHGGPGGDHTDMKAQCSQLTKRMQIVYFDHRGGGRSARGDARLYTLDENVEDLEALRRHLGLGEIVSIGTSYGGMVAMAHAARYPDTVSHLVLVATAAHFGFISRAQEIVSFRGTEEQRALCNDLFSGRIDTIEKMRHYIRETQSLYSLKPADPKLAEIGIARSILSPEALCAAFAPSGWMKTYDIREEIKQISAPTLICAGRHDWICPPEFSEEVHRLIPNSDLRIFEESGHAVASDEPEHYADAVIGFLVYNNRSSGRLAAH